MARRPPGSSVQCPAGHAASLEQSSPGGRGGEERQRPPQVPPPGRLPPSGQAGVCDKACVTALATCRALGSTRNHLARRASPGSTKEAGLHEGVGGRSARPTADTGDSPVQNQCADHSTPAERTLRGRRDYQPVISTDAIWAALLPRGLRGFWELPPRLPKHNWWRIKLHFLLPYLSNVCLGQRKFQCALPPSCPPFLPSLLPSFLPSSVSLSLPLSFPWKDGVSVTCTFKQKNRIWRETSGHACTV